MDNGERLLAKPVLQWTYSEDFERLTQSFQVLERRLSSECIVRVRHLASVFFVPYWMSYAMFIVAAIRGGHSLSHHLLYAFVPLACGSVVVFKFGFELSEEVVIVLFLRRTRSRFNHDRVHCRRGGFSKGARPERRSRLVFRNIHGW